MPEAISVLIGYLLGSIPFGLVLTGMAGLGDVRKIGSGNIGATNVLRTGNKTVAAATLLLDGAKGTAAVLLAAAFANPTGALLAGLAAVLGHMFPVWLGFKGGKGMATAIGVLLGAAWPVGVGICVVWLAVAAIFRRSSLATLAGCAGAPILALILATLPIALLALAIAVLVFWRHHENIARLIAGTEPRIGARK